MSEPAPKVEKGGRSHGRPLGYRFASSRFPLRRAVEAARGWGAACRVADSAAMEERILAALAQLSTHGTWWASAVIAVIVLSWIGFAVFFGRLRSYHDEKGRNLATKEDVAELTRIPEQVRHEFESLREAISQQNRLQLAALDKRLEAHQAAFRVWHQMAKAYGATDAGKAGKVNDDEVQAALAAWNELWEGQSLYLDVKARAAVARLASLHRDRLRRVEEHRRSLYSGLSFPQRDAWFQADVEASNLQISLRPVDEDIREALALIEQGVHLPALSPQEGGPGG